MMIPNKLKIGGHVYSIVMTEDDDILDGATGCMQEQEATIWIDSRMPKSIQESTLIHEVLHATATTLGDTDLGHALIDSISEQLYQVLSDNGLLSN